MFLTASTASSPFAAISVLNWSFSRSRTAILWFTALSSTSNTLTDSFHLLSSGLAEMKAGFFTSWTGLSVKWDLNALWSAILLAGFWITVILEPGEVSSSVILPSGAKTMNGTFILLLNWLALSTIFLYSFWTEVWS